MKLTDKLTARRVKPKEKSTTQLYKESRLAQKQLSTLLKFLPDPVFAFTLDNKVDYVNPAFERVFGWTLKEVKGKNINFIPDHLVGQVLILRDMTVEKRMAKSNRIMFRISKALHHYQKLGDLIPLIISDVAQCSFFLRRVDDETDLVTRGILSVPIKLKDRTIGVISVVNKNHGGFDNTDIELLSVVTSSIALPIENTRIHEELRKSFKELKSLNHD